MIIDAHFGNPWVQEFAKIMKQHKNIYADLSGYFTELQPIAKDEIQELQVDIQKLKEGVGDLKRFLFGTDWWLHNQKEYVAVVQSLSFSHEERDLIFWRNAKELFHL